MQAETATQRSDARNCGDRQASNSRGVRSLAEPGNPNAPAAVRSASDGELFATTRPTRANYRATAAGLHPDKKTVRALALHDGGLKSAFR
jgi:hypothetical protein